MAFPISSVQCSSQFPRRFHDAKGCRSWRSAKYRSDIRRLELSMQSERTAALDTDLLQFVFATKKGSSISCSIIPGVTTMLLSDFDCVIPFCVTTTTTAVESGTTRSSSCSPKRSPGLSRITETKGEEFVLLQKQESTMASASRLRRMIA